ncbi:MAG: hypothetical protein HCTETUND1_166 [Candidatus Hodgkinia cicadicola]|nr:MAG: hypothetical protein HCTETUND1_166 [Candidatus Hodgkinia cicadicola]
MFANSFGNESGSGFDAPAYAANTCLEELAWTGSSRCLWVVCRLTSLGPVLLWSIRRCAGHRFELANAKGAVGLGNALQLSVRRFSPAEALAVVDVRCLRKRKNGAALSLRLIGIRTERV